MPRNLIIAVLALILVVRADAEDVVPPVYNGNQYANPDSIPNVVWPYVHFKSPNPDMHFTAGQPLRVLADGLDPNAWTVDNIGTPVIELFVDGVSKGTTSQIAPDQRDWNEFIVNGLAAGTHLLELKGSYIGGSTNRGHSIQIVVEPAVPHANTVTLTQNMLLSGSQALNWTDTTVIGNGFTVRSAANWTGSLTIQNSSVSGLGGLATAGIDVSTSNGSVVIGDSVFEWTGALNVALSGTGALRVTKNQFRANCQLEFRPVNNPDKAPIFKAVGNPSGTKVFQGNNVGSGFVAFESMRDLLIGGNSDAESNILIGPRCGFSLFRCQNATLRGNYSTHNYHGEWSQGFNFIFQESTGLLVEHNVIRGGSWPVQSMTGEFRYNLVVDCGHDWVRSIGDNSLLHHNIFVHTQGGGNPNEGVWMYSGGSNVSFFNNTIDCGGTLMSWGQPAVNISQGSSMSSVRNNAITNIFPSYNPTTAVTFVQAVDGAIGYLDYNAFWNPNTANGTRYSAGAVTGKTVGQPGFGAHDVQSNVKFAQGLALPYPVKEGDVWNRVTGVSQVLASFRARYTPATGSPLIDAGDPADGVGADIGAVGAGTAHPGDLFGTFGQVNGNFPPSCRLSSPNGNAFFSTGSTIALTAEALDFDGSVSLVEFFNGTTKLGQDSTVPYTFSWPNVAAGTYTLTVRATDNKGAAASSQSVRINVGNQPPVIRSDASAIPNPALVGQAVNLSVMAGDADGDVLSFDWIFGDGATDSGATVTHTYAAAGTYAAQVTVQDGKGGVLTSSIAVEVLANPNDTGGGDGGGPSSPQAIAFSVRKWKAKMDFVKTNRDSVSLSGVLPGLPAGYDPTGKHISLNAGGALWDSVLTAKGRAKSNQGTFSLTLKQTRDKVTRKKSFAGGDAPFQALLRNGTWSANWLGSVAQNPAPSTGQTIAFSIQIALDAATYEATVPVLFTYQKSKKGKLAWMGK